jgi:EmrB/QacA subfamily drug resistance transporter
MLTPVGTAMLFRAFPPVERSKASALLTIPAVVAPASGPVLGGYLVEYQSWHWIFLINVPIGATALVVAALFLKEEKQPTTGRFDIAGFLLSGFGLAAVVYALAEAGQRGFGDGRVMAFGLGGIALLALLVVVELRSAAPMLDMRLFSNRLFTATNSVQLVSMAGMQGALFLLPLFLQAERGMSPLQSGLTTFPQALGIFFAMPFASRIYQRIGPRRMMMVGMLGIAATTFAFLWVDLTTDAWWIRLIMLGRGASFGMTLIPMQTATFATIRPQDTGRASAIFSSGRQVAASFGVALLATVLTNRLAHHGAALGNPAVRHGAMQAFHDGFFAGGVLALVGAVAALLLIRDKDAESTRFRQVRVDDEPAPAAAH